MKLNNIQFDLNSFATEMAQLSAFRFMQTILKEQLNVQQLIIGYDNRFGKQCGETFEDYVRFGAELGIEVLLLLNVWQTI